LSVQGELGLAKRTIGEATVRADGSVGVTYELLVENAGPFPLTNVEVHDQLSQAFGVGSTFVTSRVRVDPNSPCSGFASSSYDGGTIDPVLVSGVELQPNEQCRIQYDAAVIPSESLPGPFRSSAFAIASDPFSGTVIDDSTDGTNTDPDGNQEPGDNDIATSVEVVVPEPSVEISVEPLESQSVEQDGWHEFGYRITLANTGSIDIDTTRLLAPLDDQFDVGYDVVSIVGDGLIVNDGFDGDRDQNLLARQNRLRAGSETEVVLLLQSALPRDQEITLDIEFLANSVTGAPVDIQAPTITIETGSSVRSLGDWFDSLSQEEQRLIGLGAAVIALFVLLFIYRAARKTRGILAELEASRSAGDLEDESEIDLRDNSVVDLRDDSVVDVRDDAETDVRTRAHPLADDADAPADEPHHRPRRRRGRRKVNVQETES